MKRKCNTVLGARGHAGITVNEEADEGAKRALVSIPNDYPPLEDLSEWIKTKMVSSRQKRWEEGENAIKERKKNTGWQNDTERLKRRDQVAVTRLRTRYSKATTRLSVLQRNSH
jgi:hypothetical protein